jgi:two-component system, cell cycle response regulator DivK
MAHILIVEDNEMNLDILTRRLSRRGYEVSQAENGVEAIELANRVIPDLILMDLNLPVMDGWEATRHIKANPSTEAIPILCVTAHAMIDDLERGLAAGCDEYETKPIEFERILEKIERLLKA